MNAPFEILIDPAKLLLVTLQSDDGAVHTFVVVVCRFLVNRAARDPGPHVAVEIVYDPDEHSRRFLTAAIELEWSGAWLPPIESGRSDRISRSRA
jgi:hypothetical protein